MFSRQQSYRYSIASRNVSKLLHTGFSRPLNKALEITNTNGLSGLSIFSARHGQRSIWHLHAITWIIATSPHFLWFIGAIFWCHYRAARWWLEAVVAASSLRFSQRADMQKYRAEYVYSGSALCLFHFADSIVHFLYRIEAFILFIFVRHYYYYTLEQYCVSPDVVRNFQSLAVEYYYTPQTGTLDWEFRQCVDGVIFFSVIRT